MISVICTCDVCGKEIESSSDIETIKLKYPEYCLPALDRDIPCSFNAHLCSTCHYHISNLITRLSKTNND
jgi:hypothetical protein